MPILLKKKDEVLFAGNTWNVVSSTVQGTGNNRAYLVLSKGIVSENFLYKENVTDESAIDNDWEGSDARKWCNGTYFNSLEAEDPNASEAIVPALIEENRTEKQSTGSMWSFWKSSATPSTSGDKVFFLSIDEWWEYNNDYSDYVWWWWLRNPNSEDNKNVAFVFDNGYVHGNDVNCGGVGARPALFLRASLFTSKNDEGQWVIGEAEEATSDRIFGADRYETAIEVAEKYKETEGSKFKNVVVADGRDFPDALAGGYFARIKDAPILLVEPKVENKIADYINKNIESGGAVYILGGAKAVSSSFENKVKNTKRLGGETRYETNLKILKEAGVTNQDLLVCTGTGYADSLSASAAGRPILLVGSGLNEAQKSYLRSIKTSRFYLIGGEKAVDKAIEAELRGLGYSGIDRLKGDTRYETSTEVAKRFFPKAKTAMLVYAWKFPDGLSGGPLAMKKNAPIILTDSNTTGAAKSYVKSAGAVSSITLGGPGLISDDAVKAIMGS